MQSETKEQGSRYGQRFAPGERVQLVLHQPGAGLLIRMASPAGDPNALDFGWFPISIRPYDMRLEFEYSPDAAPEQVRFVVNFEHGWTFTLDLSLGPDGVTFVGGPCFSPPPGGDAMSSRVLHALGLGTVNDAVDWWLLDPWIAKTLGGAWRQRATRARRGRRRRGDLHYAQWAARYVDALSRSPAPIKSLIAEAATEGEHVTAGQLRAVLNRARSRELLTAAPPGRAGGELTDKARDLLAAAGLGGIDGVD